jgi:adenylyltransferase/sulfurtransferase
VDCTDNFTTRYLINDACVYLNKPLVYGAIHQGEGHVTVFNYNNSPTLRCLFPKDENESIASCAEIGAYNITTSIIGNMMANEVIKIILDNPDVLAGKFKQLNILDGSAITIGYENTVAGRTKSLERFNKEIISTEISVTAALQKFDQQQAVFLIDVRETEEHKERNIGGSNIPLQTLLETTAFPFSTTDEIIVYCQKGNRSRLAVNYLIKNGFINAKSLQGGIEQYLLLSAD